MKAWLSALIFAVLIQTVGCRKAVFKNIEEPSGTGTGDLINGGGGAGEGEGQPDDSTGKQLIVSVPVSELPAGSSTKATATLKDGSKPPVTWRAEDPNGKPIGKIDDDGTFHAPEDGAPTTVKIIATLKTDPSVRGEVPLKIVPKGGNGLLVSVPVPTINVGGNTVTAVAQLKDGTKNPPVTWSITSPGMGDIGKIDPSTGVYTSPATGSMSFDVIITAKLIADPTVTGSTTIKVIPSDNGGPKLTVTTPSPEIKAGEEKMQATAKLSTQTTPPNVTWTIMGPGSIDSMGVYTSPKTIANDTPVVIKATLISDPSIYNTTTITVKPNNDQIFARCTRGTEVFPIVADVYEINSTATKIPNFTSATEARKKATVCMDRYAVAPRFFDSGFPDLDKNFIEWFALNTKTQIVIPEDGNYTFILNSDDGSRLYIDGTVVIDNDGLHQAYGTGPDDLNNPAVQKRATIKLLKGVHDLRLDYFQGPKWRIALELKWIRPGSNAEEYVPRTSFK